MSAWSAVFAPKNTPQRIVARLARTLSDTLDDERVRDRLVGLGARIPDKGERGPAQLETLLKAEIARWASILKGASTTN